MSGAPAAAEAPPADQPPAAAPAKAALTPPNLTHFAHADYPKDAEKAGIAVPAQASLALPVALRPIWKI